MNARIAAALVVLLAVLGGAALLVQQQERSHKAAASGALGQPLFKGLKASDIATIRIAEPKAELTLERKENRWAIAERQGFPADLDKVSELVLKAIELKVGQLEPIGGEDRARLNLDGSGTLVEFKAADGKPLARMIVGRKYFKGEPAGQADGRFVLLPENDRQAVVVSDPLAQASAKTADWIRGAGFTAEKMKSLEFKAPDGRQWRIERADDNAEWRLAGAKAGEKLEPAKANAAAFALSNVELADIAPQGLKPEDTGLAKPAVITASTLDGLTYILRLGAAEGENYYAALAVAGAPRPAGKDAEARGKRLEERLPREKALSQYTLLIAKSKLEDLLKPRAELLAKKETKKR